MDPIPTTDEIVLELLPFYRQYKSGRIERLKGTDTVPATFDPTTAVTSKDITINPTTNLSARLYLPTLSDQSSKLPILVYFHGGGFLIETAFSPTYHNYLNAISAKAGALIVSVDYRLAPEHPLPIAYHDSLEALKWVASKSEPWVSDHGDFTRLFLSGDSAGANIAHHVAMGDAGTDVSISGLALVHPYFWGSEPVGEETTDVATRGYVERVWKAACPETVGIDDPLVNPWAPEAPSLKGMGCKRVLVFVAGKDLLKERGRVYVEELVASGWGGEAEFVVDEGVDHVYHLSEPNADKALAKMEKMVAFLKGQ